MPKIGLQVQVPIGTPFISLTLPVPVRVSGWRMTCARATRPVCCPQVNTHGLPSQPLPVTDPTTQNSTLITLPPSDWAASQNRHFSDGPRLKTGTVTPPTPTTTSITIRQQTEHPMSRQRRPTLTQTQQPTRRFGMRTPDAQIQAEIEAGMIKYFAPYPPPTLAPPLHPIRFEAPPVRAVYIHLRVPPRLFILKQQTQEHRSHVHPREPRRQDHRECAQTTWQYPREPHRHLRAQSHQHPQHPPSHCQAPTPGTSLTWQPWRCRKSLCLCEGCRTEPTPSAICSSKHATTDLLRHLRAIPPQLHHTTHSRNTAGLPMTITPITSSLSSITATSATLVPDPSSTRYHHPTQPPTALLRFTEREAWTRQPHKQHRLQPPKSHRLRPPAPGPT